MTNSPTPVVCPHCHHEVVTTVYNFLWLLLYGRRLFITNRVISVGVVCVTICAFLAAFVSMVFFYVAVLVAILMILFMLMHSLKKRPVV